MSKQFNIISNQINSISKDSIFANGHKYFLVDSNDNFLMSANILNYIKKDELYNPSTTKILEVENVSINFKPID